MKPQENWWQFHDGDCASAQTHLGASAERRLTNRKTLGHTDLSPEVGERTGKTYTHMKSRRWLHWENKK